MKTALRNTFSFIGNIFSVMGNIFLVIERKITPRKSAPSFFSKLFACVIVLVLSACGGGSALSSDQLGSSVSTASLPVQTASSLSSQAASHLSSVSTTSASAVSISASSTSSVSSVSLSANSSVVAVSVSSTSSVVTVSASSMVSAISSSLASSRSSSVLSSVTSSVLASASSSSTSAASSPSARQVKKFLTYSANSSSVRIRFLEYTPADYATSTKKYPLLVFAHGAGETSQNDDPAADATEYARIMANGPPKLINQNNPMCFTVNGVESCFIVISPQSPKGLWWSVEHIRTIFDYAETNLRVDPRRIYMTGLSMGGGITWAFARSQRSNPKQLYAGELAAIVAVAGADQVSTAACNLSKEAIPVWAFHGTADTNVSVDRSREFVDAINGILINKTIGATAVNVQCTKNPQVALLTEFAGATHNVWDTTYNPNNRFSLTTKQLDPAGVNVYEWLLSHERPSAETLKNGERSISAGTYQSYGVAKTGIEQVWGSNRLGQLGVGSNDDGLKDSTPTNNSAIDDEIISVSAGGYQGLALNRGGRVWSFGANDAGQRGDGSSSASNGVPVLLNDVDKVISVSSGGRHNMVLTSEGKVYAWGTDENGQVGRGNVGTSAACNNTVNNTAAQDQVNVPYLVSIPAKIKKISAGYCFSMALDENGNVWSWGFGDYLAAALGHGNQTYQSLSTPTKINNLNNIVSIAAGEGCAYAVNNLGQVWAWGINRLGCVGDGTAAIRSTPVLLSLTDIKNVVARAQGAYAISNTGILWSWGETMYGSVGNGSYVNLPFLNDTNRLQQPSPVQISSLNNVRDVFSGSASNTVFAQLMDGTVWSWGRNKSGNLGNGEIGDADSTNTSPDDKNKAVPTQISF